jgi:nitrile hydratase
MNGIHDVGGMHGFGAIEPDDDGELFHERWEALAFAMQVVTIHGAELYNLHEFRRAREQVAPAEYLSSAYYDNWLAAVEKILIEKDVVTDAELRERVAAVKEGEESTPESSDPALTERTLERIHNREASMVAVDSNFEAGDEVVVRNRHPEGHTRVPGYLRRCVGVVDAVHGGFQLPDASAHGEQRVEALYGVRFDAEAVWGDNSDGTAIHIDLWESYIAEAETDSSATNAAGTEKVNEIRPEAGDTRSN